jgi:Tfp pilus assembly protein PilF
MAAPAGRTYPILLTILIALVAISALCAGLHTVADYDMGWQLATGRWVVAHHQIPRTDVLSYTAVGKSWQYPPFSGVLLYLIYAALGYAGLSWFCALASLAVAAYLMRRGDLGSVILTMLAVQSIAARTAPRADLFSTVLFALCLGELVAFQRNQPARPWLLPLLMLFWVNLHPGFIAGLGAMSAYLLLEALDLLIAERRTAVLERTARIAPWLAASVLATFANPWGWGIYRASLTLSGLIPPHQGQINSSAFIGEFRGIPISIHLLECLIDVRQMEHGLTWLLAIAVLLVLLFSWKRQFGAALLTFGVLYAGLSHARYIGIFCIAVVVLGGSFLSGLMASASAAGDRGLEGRFAVPYPMGVLAVSLLTIVTLLHIADFVTSRTYIVSNSDWRFGAGESYWFPERAAGFIESQQLPGNIFEEYDLGGFAAWRLGPHYPDFIDGRGDRLSPDLIPEQLKLYREGADSLSWQSDAERWNINVLLVSAAGTRGLNRLQPLDYCQSATWKPVYMDDVSLVMLRNTPQNRPWIERLQVDCLTHPLTPPSSAPATVRYDFDVNAGALLLELGRNAEAREALKHASELFPMDPNAHRLLALLYQRGEQYQEAEAEYRSALALQDDSTSLFELGLMVAKQGRYAEALQLVERAASMDVYPTQMYITAGHLHILQREARPSLADFDEAEKSSPFRNGGESLAPELYAQMAQGRADAYQLAGELGLAIEQQRKAVQLTPRVARRWERLGELYQATGEAQLADKTFQQASALSGVNASH